MKPLADHGTTARAKGRPTADIKGCGCRPCRDAENAYSKRRRYLNETGRTLMVDAAPVTRHVQQLFTDGAGWNQIKAAASCSQSTIYKLRYGQLDKIHRSTANRILAVQLTDALPYGKPVPATGTIRRLRALTAIGHSLSAIANASQIHEFTIRKTISGRLNCARSTAAAVADAYRLLSEIPGTSVRSRNRAAAEGWAPTSAWDPDTIDDPEAIPEWTGFCGTDRGWWVHRLERIPVCPPCQAAHDEWRAGIAHLPPKERVRASGQAQAAARTREADLAHDGRELMRLGADYEQAADRLGVTRQYLQQAMLRHPEPQPAAA